MDSSFYGANRHSYPSSDHSWNHFSQQPNQPNQPNQDPQSAPPFAGDFLPLPVDSFHARPSANETHVLRLIVDVYEDESRSPPQRYEMYRCTDLSTTFGAEHCPPQQPPQQPPQGPPLQPSEIQESDVSVSSLYCDQCGRGSRRHAEYVYPQSQANFSSQEYGGRQAPTDAEAVQADQTTTEEEDEQARQDKEDEEMFVESLPAEIRALWADNPDLRVFIVALDDYKEQLEDDPEETLGKDLVNKYKVGIEAHDVLREYKEELVAKAIRQVEEQNKAYHDRLVPAYDGSVDSADKSQGSEGDAAEVDDASSLDDLLNSTGGIPLEPHERSPPNDRGEG